MQDLIERVERLLAAGEVDAASAIVRSFEAADPAAHALGLAAVAAHAQDAAGCTRHAERAHALRPGEPMVLHYLAVAALLRGERERAEDHARDAVARGGGLRSLGWLANLELGDGKLR